MIDQDRVAVANLAMQSFVPSVRFYVRNNRLRMQWDHRQPNPRHDFAADLRSEGNWPRWGYNQRPTGGTGYQGIAQLIRYIRDLPRLPIDTWEYWAGDKIQLCTEDTVRVLIGGGYNDMEKTKCVLCGRRNWGRTGLDWWSLDGVTGPCCGGWSEEGCKQKHG